MSFSSDNRTGVIENLEARIAPAIIYGVDLANQLYSFDSANLGKFLTASAITGLGAGEKVLAIDFRPASGELFALGKDGNNAGHLYHLAPNGTATPVGSAPLAISLGSTSFVDIDFDPTADEIRVVTGDGLNFRINPATGEAIDSQPNTAGVQPDSALAFAAGDKNTGVAPFVTGAAYLNSYQGAVATRLIDIDGLSKELLAQEPAGAGTLNTLGQLLANKGQLIGLDILPGNYEGFTTLLSGNTSKLVRLDFVNGQAQVLGAVKTPFDGGLVSIAALPSGLGINGHTATYRDVDGDLVTVKVSKGTLTLGNFSFSTPNPIGGVQLVQLDLSVAQYAGATVSISTRAGGGVAGGNGFVNVGRVDATGIDLASLTIKGDLGSLTLGDSNAATLAAKTLTISSHGAVGLASQAGMGDLNLNIVGGVTTASLGLVSAKVSFTGAVSTLTAKSLYSAELDVAGITSSATFGNVYQGNIRVSGDVKSFSAKNLEFTTVAVQGVLGKLAIVGDILSTNIAVQGRSNPANATQAVAIQAITVGGDVLSSNLLAGYNSSFAAVNGSVQLGSLTVNGDWSFSNLAVGISAGTDNSIGTDDDHALAVTGTPGSRIANIIIKGQVSGGAAAFEANQIAAMSAGGVKVRLTKELDNLVVGPNFLSGNVLVREFPLASA